MFMFLIKLDVLKVSRYDKTVQFKNPGKLAGLSRHKKFLKVLSPGN